MLIGTIIGVALLLATVVLVSRPAARPQSIKVERQVEIRPARRRNPSGRC